MKKKTLALLMLVTITHFAWYTQASDGVQVYCRRDGIGKSQAKLCFLSKTKEENFYEITDKNKDSYQFELKLHTKTGVFNSWYPIEKEKIYSCVETKKDETRIKQMLVALNWYKQKQLSTDVQCTVEKQKYFKLWHKHYVTKHYPIYHLKIVRDEKFQATIFYKRWNRQKRKYDEIKITQKTGTNEIRVTHDDGIIEETKIVSLDSENLPNFNLPPKDILKRAFFKCQSEKPQWITLVD